MVVKFSLECHRCFLDKSPFVWRHTRNLDGHQLISDKEHFSTENTLRWSGKNEKHIVWKITYHTDLKSPLNRFIKWLSHYCKRFALDFPSPSHSQKNNLSRWDRLLHWPDSICSITPLCDTFLFHNDLVAPRPATMIQLTFARGCATSVTACSEQQAAVRLGATSPCSPKFNRVILSENVKKNS